MSSEQKLKDHIALVTGAGRGLGHGVARGLAAHGATVLAVSRTCSELDELESTVRSSDGQIETFPVDIGSRESINVLADEILEKYGRIDSLINNAAVLRMKSFLDLTEQEFDETIDVNLLAPVHLARRFLPAMIENGRGAIINVSSGAGVRGFVDETDYCATKFGLEGFSFSLAMELEASNISVNLMSPGYRIKPTSITAAEFETWSEEDRAIFRDPIDMADGFAFLCLQDGQGVTGQRFNAWELSEKVRNEGWNWHQGDAAAHVL
jgi:3-oxoacyl-[acyl-carrier protein] reductase